MISLEFNGIGYKLRGIAAVPEDITYYGRIKCRVFRGSQQENRFNGRIEIFIDLADASFEFKIGRGPETSKQEPGVQLFTQINGKAFV